MGELFEQEIRYVRHKYNPDYNYLHDYIKYLTSNRRVSENTIPSLYQKQALLRADDVNV